MAEGLSNAAVRPQATGGGWAGYCGKAGSIHAQSGASAVQMVICGAIRLGSSRAPARMKISCGRTSARLNNGVPQVAQKPRCITLPLSATLSCHAGLPSTANEFDQKATLTMPLPAPRYWHSLHQQMRAASGGPSTANRTAPHRHPPLTIAADMGPHNLGRSTRWTVPLVSGFHAG